MRRGPWADMRYGAGRSARSLSFIGQPPDLQIAAQALETVPSQVAEGAQALKRAGAATDRIL